MATKEKKTKKQKVVEPANPETTKKAKGKIDKPLVSPTAIKHKRVLKYMAEKGCPMKEALRALGYSKTVQNSPSKVTNTKTWKQLLNEYLPEDKLLKVHDQQLNSYKLQSMIFQKQIDDEIIYELIESINAVLKKIVEIPTGKVVFYITADNQSRNKALEMGLKLHKKLTDKVEVKDTTPYTQLSDAELAERIKKGKHFFLKK